MSFHPINSSGQRRSILNDVDEQPTPSSGPPTYQFGAINHFGSSYSLNSLQSSYPPTPALERSDSCDSQPSGNEGPMTPPTQAPSAYPDVYAGSHSAVDARRGDKNPSGPYRTEGLTLPPIRNIVPETLPEAMEMDPVSPSTRPQLSSNPFTVPYRSAATTMPEAPMTMMPENQLRCSIEYPDDAEQSQSPSLRNDMEPPTPVEEKTRESRSTASKRHSSNALKDATKEKRYKCKYANCGKTYTTSGHASRHAKAHSGEKDIICTHLGCEKRFTRSDNMKQHLETHRKDKTRANRRPPQYRGTTAERRQSRASNPASSVSQTSTPRDTPAVLSPGLSIVTSQMWPASPSADSPLVLSPPLASNGSFSRRDSAPRSMSGMDALAMAVAVQERQESRPSIQPQQSPTQSYPAPQSWHSTQPQQPSSHSYFPMLSQRSPEDFNHGQQ